MEILSCLLEIQHRFDSLTPTEKRIARYIAENSSRVPMMPIDELAENARILEVSKKLWGALNNRVY